MKYTDENRGKIQNHKYASQLNDFSGLRIKNITPTDIDGFIDYKNIAFVFFEIKRKGSDVPFGQDLALKRLCDACKVRAIYFVAEHETNEGDIDTANCIVRSHYRNGSTVIYKKERFLVDAINSFIFGRPKTTKPEEGIVT